MADKKYPDRVIPRHSKQTRFTHGVVAVACIWLAISGLFVFVPALANAFPGVSQAMRVSHRIVGAIFILVPVISAITAPQGFKAFCKKYFKKWTPEDFEFMKKFVPYMLGPKKVHMPDQDEVKSGQAVADGFMILCGLLMAVSGVVLWLGTSVWHAGAGAIMVMRLLHDLGFILLIVFGLAHIYLGAGVFQPYRGMARVMWKDGKIPESDALYHWGFWARKEIEEGNVEEEK
ncbi:MAG: cytochrome b/b6 domain-containing protein [Coriobacteriaceae bacterium]|nr:cytochrome b/b6 domain-containing protein [Coriobacteriaceae bacterium]